MRIFLTLVFISTIFFSCQDESLNREVELLRDKNKQLMDEYMVQDSVLADFMESFNQISTNLEEIREREALIEVNAENKSKSQHEQITSDIEAINELMVQNKQKVEDLEKQLKSAKSGNWRLRKAMENLKTELTAQIEQKDAEIVALKENLQEMQFTIEELNTNIEELQLANQEKEELLNEREEKIAAQTNEINTGFYVSGSNKDLLNKSIVLKEGGFLGLGQSTILNPELNPQDFNKIDITEVKMIPVSGKKVELVTTHPQGSYKFEEQDNEISSLVILDADKFWNSSKFLVVKTN